MTFLRRDLHKKYEEMKEEAKEMVERERIKGNKNIEWKREKEEIERKERSKAKGGKAGHRKKERKKEYAWKKV